METDNLEPLDFSRSRNSVSKSSRAIDLSRKRTFEILSDDEDDNGDVILIGIEKEEPFVSPNRKQNCVQNKGLNVFNGVGENDSDFDKPPSMKTHLRHLSDLENSDKYRVNGNEAVDKTTNSTQTNLTVNMRLQNEKSGEWSRKEMNPTLPFKNCGKMDNANIIESQLDKQLLECSKTMKGNDKKTGGLHQQKFSPSLAAMLQNVDPQKQPMINNVPVTNVDPTRLKNKTGKESTLVNEEEQKVAFRLIKHLGRTVLEKVGEKTPPVLKVPRPEFIRLHPMPATGSGHTVNDATEERVERRRNNSPEQSLSSKKSEASSGLLVAAKRTQNSNNSIGEEKVSAHQSYENKNSVTQNSSASGSSKILTSPCNRNVLSDCEGRNSVKLDNRSSSIIDKLRERIFNIKPLRPDNTKKRPQLKSKSPDKSKLPEKVNNTLSEDNKVGVAVHSNTIGRENIHNERKTCDSFSGDQVAGNDLHTTNTIPKSLIKKERGIFTKVENSSERHETADSIVHSLKSDENQTQCKRETKEKAQPKHSLGKRSVAAFQNTDNEDLLQMEHDSLIETMPPKKMAAFVQTANSVAILPLNTGRYLKPKTMSVNYRRMDYEEDDPRSKISNQCNHSKGTEWHDALISFKESIRVPKKLIYVPQKINKYVPILSKFKFDSLHRPPPSLYPVAEPEYTVTSTHPQQSCLEEKPTTVGRLTLKLSRKPKVLKHLRKVKRLRTLQLKQSASCLVNEQDPQPVTGSSEKPAENETCPIELKSRTEEVHVEKVALPSTGHSTVEHNVECKKSPQLSELPTDNETVSEDKSNRVMDNLQISTAPPPAVNGGSSVDQLSEFNNQTDTKDVKERNIWASLSFPMSSYPISSKTTSMSKDIPFAPSENSKPKKEFKWTTKKLTSNLAFLKNVTKQFTRPKTPAKDELPSSTDDRKTSGIETLGGKCSLEPMVKTDDDNISSMEPMVKTDDDNISSKEPMVKTDDDDDDDDDDNISSNSTSVKDSHRRNPKSNRRKCNRSLLTQIANSDGYVAEATITRKSDNLYADPAQLGREERALQRAIIQFSQLEMKSLKRENRKISSDSSKNGDSVSKDTVEQCSQSTKSSDDVSSVKITKKYNDFRPTILEKRTRTLSERRSSKPFHKDDAYERILIREEERFRRLRENRRRRDMTRIINAVAHTPPLQNPESKMPDDSEPKPDVGEVWEIDKSKADTINPDKDYGQKRLMLKLYRRSVDSKEAENQPSTIQNSPSKIAQNSFAMKKVRKSRIGARAPRRGAKKMNLKSRWARRKMVSSSRSLSNVDAGVENKNLGNDGARIDNNSDSQAATDIRRLSLAARKTVGETVLHRAARMGYEESVRYCLANGNVDVNARDNAGYTALHECCVWGYMAIAQDLISHGADVNCGSHDGTRPIHDAVVNDHIEMVRLLLSHGADPTLATYADKSPLLLARTDKMKTFLKGFLADLNGASRGIEESAWETQSAFTPVAGADISGFDLFAECPSDCDGDSFMEFDACDRSIPPSYTLCLGRENKSGSYMLLEDVLKVVVCTRADFLSQNKDIRLICLTQREFNQKLKKSQIAEFPISSNILHKSYVELLEYDDILRDCLGLRMERVHNLPGRQPSPIPWPAGERGQVTENNSLCFRGGAQSSTDSVSAKRCGKPRSNTTSIGKNKENMHRINASAHASIFGPFDTGKSQTTPHTLEDKLDNVHVGNSPEHHDFKVGTTPEECFGGLMFNAGEKTSGERMFADSDASSLGYVSDIDESVFD